MTTYTCRDEDMRKCLELTGFPFEYDTDSWSDASLTICEGCPADMECDGPVDKHPQRLDSPRQMSLFD